MMKTRWSEGFFLLAIVLRNVIHWCDHLHSSQHISWALIGLFEMFYITCGVFEEKPTWRETSEVRSDEENGGRIRPTRPVWLRWFVRLARYFDEADVDNSPSNDEESAVSEPTIDQAPKKRGIPWPTPTFSFSSVFSLSGGQNPAK